jgi:hypothetical protein
MAKNVVGLMSTPKYAKNVLRTGDIDRNAPHTVLSTDTGGTTIVLPLPINLNSSMGADWQQEGVGVIKSFLLHNKDLGSDLLSSSSYMDVLNTLDKKGAEIIRGGNKDVKALLARSRNTSSKLAGSRLAGNPRNEMLFHGMPFKQYSFTFNLIPYRKQDSEDIQNAIRAIQLASAPELRFTKMFMEYPNTWFISFMAGGGKSGGSKYLMRINECACTAVNVNYTPQGDSSNMHEENAPIAVELGLEFSEVYIPSKETIRDGYNG